MKGERTFFAASPNVASTRIHQIFIPILIYFCKKKDFFFFFIISFYSIHTLELKRLFESIAVTRFWIGFSKEIAFWETTFSYFLTFFLPNKIYYLVILNLLFCWYSFHPNDLWKDYISYKNNELFPSISVCSG